MMGYQSWLKIMQASVFFRGIKKYVMIMEFTCFRKPTARRKGFKVLSVQ